MKAHKSKNSFAWVKGDSGELYVCPIELTKNGKKLTEEELKKYCLNDSERPWND